MTKQLPPKEKHLTLKELVNLPEGTEVEYWYSDGEFGRYNPLIVGEQGQAYNKAQEFTSWWDIDCTYTLKPEAVRRLKPLHVVLAEADNYRIGNDYLFVYYKDPGVTYTVHLTEWPVDIEHGCRQKFCRDDWPDCWYEYVEVREED